MGGLPPGPENSWCSSSSSRETATWRCCWTCGSPSAPSRRIGEHVELAVSFAATVVADLCRKGDGNIYLGATAAASAVHGRPGVGRPCCKT